MVIKNKDGSTFQLRKPNPLTSSQEWKDMILHNCEWTPEVAEAPKIAKVSEPPPKPPEDIPEFPKINVEVIEQLDEAPVEDGVQTVSTLPKEDIPQKTLQNVIRVHCLPAAIHEEEDALYGEVRQSVVYGNKFAFEAIVMDRQDLYIRLWTNQKIPKESIIFPSVFVKGNIKFGDYRWWKIQSFEEKAGGYLITGVASEISPDFS